VVVEGEDDDFELLAEVEDVVLHFEVFLFEGDDELVHDQAGEQVLLYDS
jgi:hypothetical protein